MFARRRGMLISIIVHSAPLGLSPALLDTDLDLWYRYPVNVTFRQPIHYVLACARKLPTSQPDGIYDSCSRFAYTAMLQYTAVAQLDLRHPQIGLLC